MSDFAERLPWRLSALAGLLVGTASLLAGTDPWHCLERVGAAFLAFAVLGIGLRALLRQSLVPASPKKPSLPGKTSAPDAPGSHVDETTPEMTVDDL